MKALIEAALAQGMDYTTYRSMVSQLIAQGKTTGPNQSDFYVDITKLNHFRMERLDRKARFLPEMEKVLAEVKNPLTMLVLTEAWCGDAAQTTPLLRHMASASDQLNLYFVLRDEHPELIDNFLTNGGRSIPKVLFLDAATKAVLGSWGPRPEPAQEMAMAYKHKPEPKEDYNTFNVALHKWYAKDKTQTSQTELVTLLQQIGRN